jgi:Pectate lyase superfamily protein
MKKLTQHLSIYILFFVNFQTFAQEEFVGPFPSWKNIKTAYGAVGDGITDDTQAIQNALNDLKNVASNNWSVLYFPAGTYRITNTLTTVRVAHQDYLGGHIIGEDPLTTILKWDGAIDQAMFRFDSWYSKISRLTFDGNNKANIGLLKAGAFATYCEVSDLVFKRIHNGIGLKLGEDATAGIAEQAIYRCRFYDCTVGILTSNFNTLDIYIMNCFFQDNGEAIRDNTGAYHAYENVFLRSKVADMSCYSSMGSAIVNNVSVGSKRFLYDICKAIQSNY